MDDDLNTSAALAVLFDLARPLRALANRIERGDADAIGAAASEAIQAPLALLTELAGVLGLQYEAGPSKRSGSEGLDNGAITALIEQRRTAKAGRDFAEADRIRDELRGQGIELIDRPGGSTEWLRR
jgi:cysteinyl-tRNA synthetase